MIDRYTITVEKQLLAKSYDFLQHIPNFDKQYNAAPSKNLPITTTDDPDQIQLYQWGFISILSNNRKMSPKLFNTNINEGITKPALKKQLAQKRCLIFATGFFVWKQVAKKTITPYYIHPSNNEILTFGGFWEEKDEFVEDSKDSFNMLTSNAQVELQDYQSDIPLIIPRNKAKEWLDPTFDLSNILNWISVPSGINWNVFPVSPAISKLELNDKMLIERTLPADQHGNYTLFG
jgi:putative SOS response-associated peptidase YedK